MGRVSLSLLGIISLLVLLMLYVFHLWTGGAFSILWRLLGTVLGFAMIAEWWLDRLVHVTAEADYPDRVFLGHTFDADFHLSANKSGLICRCRFVPASGFRLKRNRNMADSLRVSLRAVDAGEQPLGEVFARVSGIFGLTRWDHAVNCDLTVLVEPESLLRSADYLGFQHEQKRASNVQGSGHELLQLREYRPGDSFRDIDWKVTAKTRKKVVRIYERENQLDLMIMLDRSQEGRFEVDELGRLAHFVNAASRLSETAIRAGDRVGLCAYGATQVSLIPPARSAGHLKSLRNLLGRVTVEEGQANHLSAYFSAANQLPRRSLIVFFTHLDQLSANDHLLRATALASAQHLTLIAAVRDVELRKLRSAPVTDWKSPYIALAASQQIRIADHQAQSVRRRGGQLVYTRAELLDERLLDLYQEIRKRRLVA